MKKHPFNPLLALVSTLSLVAGSSVVYAQQATPKEKAAETQAVEEVVITGFRKSVVNALEVKRSADTVVEAISADDIGGLPDVSIADSLSRLPGVNTVRTGGQASEINIRGMSGDFVFATMNGREQVSTSTGPVAGRKIEFDVYPSELISQAAVYKSPKASLIEGGVAGSIEMTTVNPLKNTKEHSFTAGIRGSKNSRTDEVEDAIGSGSRVNLTYQGKFADDTLGVALGYAKLDAPNVANQYIGLNYSGDGADVDNNPLTGHLDKDGKQTGKEYVSEGMEIQQRSGEEKRDSYLGTVVWQPTDTFTLKGDVFKSTADTEAFARGFRIKSLSNANSFSNPTFDGLNLIGGTLTANGDKNLAVFVVNDNDSSKSDVLNTGLNAEWSLDKLTVTADVSYSKSNGNFVNGGTRALLYNDTSAATPVRTADTIAYLNKGLNPAQLSTTKNYGDASHLMLTEVGQWPFITHNKIAAERIDFKYALDDGFIKSVESGVRYSSREYTGERAIDHYGSEFGDSVSEKPIKLPAGATKVVSFRGELAGFPDFVALDLNDAIAAVEAARGKPWSPVRNWNDNWTMIQTGTVTEDVVAGYVMANFESEVGTIPYTGNIGVRVVHSDQSSDGVLQVGGGIGEPITDGRGVVSKDYVKTVLGKKYTDYLPSLNVNFELSERDQVRVGLAKVMSRPPVSKMKSGGGSWIDGENKFNVWGNTSPYLDPMYADQADVSYEHYLEDSKGAIVVALFRKNVKSFVEDQTLTGVDFKALGFAVPDINPVTNKAIEPGGQYQTAINNTKGGYIQGIELGYTQTFNFLPSFWSGLGVSASYSYTDSNVERTNSLGGESRSITMPGLSPTNVSTTLFYDYEQFSTRLNYRYRDAFVANQVAVETQEVFYAKEAVLDYQASYKLDNGLEFVFQVNNLTDEPSKTYFGNESQTGTIQYFGRQYFLGVNYKM